MKRLWFAMLWLLPLCAPAFGVPEYLNYQGRITDATGAPMQGSYAMAFSIHDATRAGNQVWGPFECDGAAGEGHADAVMVWDGWFNVILGPRDVAGRSVLSAFTPIDGGPRFIEITVAGQTITPRQEFLSAPFAAQARTARTSLEATYALHGVPAGCVLAFFGNAAPEGWLLCDGSPLPAGSEFDTLRALVGPNTPDLRGRVILMPDPAGTVLPNTTAALGETGGEEQHTLTVAEMPAHNHDVGEYNKLLRVVGAHTIKYADNSPTEPDVKTTRDIVPSGGNQPHNNMQPFFALNWIIKY